MKYIKNFNNVHTKYADTKDELRLKIIGLFHDHCYHLYFGLTDKVPEKYLKYIDDEKSKKYVFIYEEDVPKMK